MCIQVISRFSYIQSEVGGEEKERKETAIKLNDVNGTFSIKGRRIIGFIYPGHVCDFLLLGDWKKGGRKEGEREELRKWKRKNSA